MFSFNLKNSDRKLIKSLIESQNNLAKALNDNSRVVSENNLLLNQQDMASLKVKDNTAVSSSSSEVKTEEFVQSETDEVNSSMIDKLMPKKKLESGDQ